jgi:hypothetical protein
MFPQQIDPPGRTDKMGRRLSEPGFVDGGDLIDDLHVPSGSAFT